MRESMIRVALLGAGYISDWHIAALKRVENVQVTAICDVAESAARSLARKCGVANVYTSLDDLIDAKVADCVHILTPPHTHFQNAEQLISAGVPVFVEKPMTLSAAECQALHELGATNGTLIGVNHNFLMLPSYERLKQDLTNGVIGPIDTIDINWQFPLPPLRSGPFGMWMLREPQNLLFEIGPHLYSFVADIFGQIEVTDVRLRNPITIPGGITHFQIWQISLNADGALVTLNLSLVEGHDNRSVHVRGLGGAASYDFAQDTYRLEVAPMQDIVIGPLAAQLSVAKQAIGAGVKNAFRQVKSLNTLSPYGLSITRAVQTFYSDMRAGRPIDRRLRADLAVDATAMIEQTIVVAAPQLAQANVSLPKIASTAADKGKTFLVIGGTGFIGRALTNNLADQGYHARVFTRGSGAGLAREDGRISAVSGSMSAREDLLRAMDGIDGVFHLAKATENTWQGYLDNDVAVTKLIGECCLEAGVARLVYTGTIDSYDASQADRLITEETPFDDDLEQRNLYARSKAACEQSLKTLETDKALPLVIVRPGIVIGKGGPLQHWGIAMWRGATACKIWGDGNNIMPFVLVDDVADGLVRAMVEPAVNGRSFNLIGEPMLSSLDYFNAVGEANGVKLRAKPTPIWTYYVIDLAKYWAKSILARKTGLTKPSYRDWKSRTQISPYRNDTAKQLLGWKPEADRNQFIQRGIVDANLFGAQVEKREIKSPQDFASDEKYTQTKTAVEAV